VDRSQLNDLWGGFFYVHIPISFLPLAQK